MTTYVATLTFERGLTEAQLIELGELVDRVDGSVAQHPHGIDIRLYVDETDPVYAASSARLLATGLHPDSRALLIGLDVVTEAEHRRRADTPTLPELMSAPEVGELLDISRQRVHQLRTTAAFPAPLYTLKTGPIWSADAIRKFAREWTRKPGKPAKAG